MISQKQIVADTMVGGATLTKLISTSAWYAPRCCGSRLVKSIVRDEKKFISLALHSTANMAKAIFVLACQLLLARMAGKKIVDFGLNEEERAAFNKSADAVRNMNDVLKTL